MSLRLAVFASGSGTNLQALIDRFNRDAPSPATVGLVVSDRADAGALRRAHDAGIPGTVIPVAGRDPDQVTLETFAALENAEINAIALAGYLRLVPGPVVNRYRARIVNIHPALLPAFGGRGMYGMRVHRAVLEAGCLVTGVTVHYVDERYDEGQPLAQWPVPVLRNDTPESLARRVLRVEHMLYPIAIELLAKAVRDGSDRLVTANFAAVDDVSCFGATAEHDLNEQHMRRTFGLD